MDKLTQEFLAESFEGLDRMDQCLTELEARPEDAGLISEIFRAVHTIKGTTAFLGHRRMERLAHAGEHVLSALRESRAYATPAVIGGLLKLMDAARMMLHAIERSGAEGVDSDDADVSLIALLEGLRTEANHGPFPLEPRGMVAGDAAAWRDLSEKTIRVDVELMNRMMNLVGELVLTRNRMLLGNGSVEDFPELSRRLDCVTVDLRDTVMQARIQPVQHLFSKVPRMVRDLALACGKDVKLVSSGQETGLDKGLLEAIKDPLTHAVRNAIAHGVESPEERSAAGKPRQGTIRLRASQSNGSVVIEVSDDGAGISQRRIRETAVTLGLVTRERAESMRDRDALQMIFLPGFSTAAEVTHVAGRGVGMDVVKHNVERVSGTVAIESIEGVGTVVRLRVPLTLAILPALVVNSGGHRFCIPQEAVLEVVRVAWTEINPAVQRFGGEEFYRLRASLLPMAWLDRVLECEATEPINLERWFYLVVCELEGRRFGLAVDKVTAPVEIVAKPLTGALREIGVYTGATVLSDGELALILDVAGLVVRAGVELVPQEASDRLEEDEPSFAGLVVFEGRNGQRVELELEMVERIDRFSAGAVRFVEGLPRICLENDELVPLEEVSSLWRGLAGADAKADEALLVAICRRQHATGRVERFGLVVRAVLEVGAGSFGGHRAEENVSALPERWQEAA